MVPNHPSRLFPTPLYFSCFPSILSDKRDGTESPLVWYRAPRTRLSVDSSRELVSLSPVLSACAQDALTGRRGGKRLAAGVE